MISGMDSFRNQFRLRIQMLTLNCSIPLFFKLLILPREFSICGQDQNGEDDGESKDELMDLAAERVQLLLNLEFQVYNSHSGLHSFDRSIIP